MVELKASTKRGQAVIASGEACKGVTLRDIYASWSDDKQKYYDDCYTQYLETEEHYNFRVKACGSWSFVASWMGTKDGENIMRVETRDNSYLVWLDR